jgi:hypothetical protein
MKNIPVLNTIDEMVAAALIYTDKRFKLRDSTDYVYDDPEAGEEWQNARVSVIGTCPGYGKEGYEEWSKRDDAYDETKPSMYLVKSYELSESYDTWYALSPELGEKLDSVWTKKQSRYYRDTLERTGTLTLAGMLKRLGRTDVGQKIKDAKYRRNNLRQQLAKKMDELEKWVNDYGKEIGVTAEMFNLPVEIADCLKMEE